MRDGLGTCADDGYTLTWKKMKDLSPMTTQYLGKTHRLWRRLDDGCHMFVVMPISQRPSEGNGGYGSVEAALWAKGLSK